MYVSIFLIILCNHSSPLISYIYVLSMFILHLRESELYRYILDGTSALAWELPLLWYLGHLPSTLKQAMPCSLLFLSRRMRITIAQLLCSAWFSLSFEQFVLNIMQQVVHTLRESSCSVCKSSVGLDHQDE